MAGSSSRGFGGGSDVIGDVQDKTGFASTRESRGIHDSSKCGVLLSTKAETSEKLIARRPLYTVTARELHACIISSESTRAVCSIFIALVVVLSHTGLPLLGVNIVSSKSILAAKPLYMVLLSGITVMASHFILSKRGGRPVVTEEVHKEVSHEGLNWARAFMVLERGLVLHHTIRAIFIDCSVYLVIVACGLSIVKPT